MTVGVLGRQAVAKLGHADKTGGGWQRPSFVISVGTIGVSESIAIEQTKGPE